MDIKEVKENARERMKVSAIFAENVMEYGVQEKFREWVEQVLEVLSKEHMIN